jgi:ABC-type multidrug transport system fused ATPase/permease subunit
VRRFSAAYPQLQRLDANTRTPLQVHVQESLLGAPVIRSLGAASRFVTGCDERCDNAARASMSFILAGRCFAVNLEVLGACVLLSVGVTCTLLAASVGAPLAGLALSWGTNFSTSLGFFTASITEFGSKIVSMERLAAYSELPPEPVFDDPSLPHVVAKPPADWPSAGALIFDDVTFSYRPGLPPALRQLSFSAAPGERLGIVGRTGAGKSSIATALLRLRELASGRVLVDGVDLASLSLADVRARGVCCLPQEPLLLTGSVRDNLLLRAAGAGPSDADVWAALDAVRMKVAVSALPMGLDSPVSDAGINFSAGERQLLCFARALLRSPRLLLLDEATASTDDSSDTAIQSALRRSFGAVTTLAIAHRLGTVIDSDRVLVMARGALAEQGPPHELLERAGSLFGELVASLGPAAAAALREQARARDARVKRHPLLE